MAQNHDEGDLSIFDDVIEGEQAANEAGEFVPYGFSEDDDADENPEEDLIIDKLDEYQEYDPDDDEEGNDAPTIPSYKESPLINDVLALKGIKNHTIQFENEEGDIEDVDFYDLPKNEQLAILNSSDKDIDFDLETYEIEAVNFLRENGVTFEEAVDYFKREAVEEYINSQNIAGIEVDQYSDEQLFALDLKAKYEDLTDEEITIEIGKQLEHPDLFKKKVDKLRTEYKEIEISQLQAAKQQQEQLDEQRFTDLQNNLITVAESVADIGGLDLDNNDKNEILSYILEKDINGVSPFIKSLDSPEKLFELAWYATKGKEAFDILHDYYKKQIDSVRKTSYQKGKEEATAKSKPTDRKSFVRDQPKAKPEGKFKHIDSFDLETD